MTTIRNFKNDPVHHHRLYLTFDDGPEENGTPQVLDLLYDLQVRATFYVVTQKAFQQRGLIKRILEEGHAIGDHSFDHSYLNFFRSEQCLQAWIEKSQKELKQMCCEESAREISIVGFRPPAGVVTPPLIRVLKRLKIPLVLWWQRYFDTVLPFTEGRAKAAVSRLQSGDLVLLHDREFKDRMTALEIFVRGARERGFQFHNLSLGKN